MVELTPEQLEKLYGLLDEKPPVSVCTEEISRVIIKLENKINPYFSEDVENQNFAEKKKVLIIDDLELSVFQLSKLLIKTGYETFVARNFDEAYDFYKKQSFHYVLLDLFLPEPADGLKLLELFVSSIKTKQNETKIIVISGCDDKDLIKKCFDNGANEFIGKNKDWHKHVLRRIRKFDELKQGPTPDIITKIEDETNKIASIRVNKFAKQNAKDDLKREILSLINTGYNRLVLDFENIHSISPSDINIVIMAFKKCQAAGGDLKLSGVNTLINEALSYVFLDGIIPVYINVQRAIETFSSIHNEVKN